MRLLFLGDVVGRPGRAVIIDRLPALIERYKLDFVAVNGENAAGGFGITEEICQNLIDAGADAVTLGNHAFDQREALVFIARQPRLIRPLNYPAGTPGRGANLVMAKNGARVLVMNVLGRVFMDAMDDPFAGVARELDACPLGEQADAVIIDMHAEASSEKQGMGYFADGRASLVVGTHTHVPTADHRILPQGTAFMGDVGMCGDYESMLGMEREEPLQRFQSKISRQRLEPAAGPGTLAGVCVDVDDRTGLARHIAPLRLGGVLEEAVPSFWN